MSDLYRTFIKICERNDIVLLDTCICSKSSSIRYPLNDEEMEQVSSILGPAGLKRITEPTVQEKISYVNELTEAVSKNSNATTTDLVIHELNKFMSHIGGAAGNRGAGGRRRLLNYKNAVLGLKRILESRKIEFSESEERKMQNFYKNLDFLKYSHKLSETDFDMSITAANSAISKGNTVMLTNDVGILLTVRGIAQNQNEIEYDLKPYTSIGRNYFFPFKRGRL